jgi:hypothetical protein
MTIIDKISPTRSLVTVICRMCAHEYSFTVITAHLLDWQHGKLIQDAMPELSSAQRELLMTSTCEECWDKMF